VTECGRCGDCCTDISLTTTKKAFTASLTYGDARDDAAWAEWLAKWEANGWGVPDRANWIRYQADARFIAKHWHGGKRGKRTRDGKERTVGWECDQFNPETRQCMAYEGRPPICAGFPYYTDDGKPGVIPAGRLPTRCSFWADYPESARPEGWVPIVFLGVRAV